MYANEPELSLSQGQVEEYLGSSMYEQENTHGNEKSINDDTSVNLIQH